MTRSSSKSIDLVVAAETSTPRLVRRTFAQHFAPSPRLQDLLLCLSEVITNAVLHAGPPIRVVGVINNATLRVEVSDGSTRRPVRRPPSDLAPTGRGLLLLDQLTEQWGVDVRPDGKTVWFEIDGVARG